MLRVHFSGTCNCAEFLTEELSPSHSLSFPQASFQSSCNSMINGAILLYIIRAGIRDINPVMNVLVHQINFKAGNSPSCVQRGIVLWSCLLTFAWDFYQLNVCRALSVMMPGLCLLSASLPDRTRLSQTNFMISRTLWALQTGSLCLIICLMSLWIP